MQALSQLSYGPLLPSQCSGQLIPPGPTDIPPLAVPGLSNSQLERATRRHLIEWDEKATTQLWAINPEDIDLASHVSTPHKS